MGAVRVSGRVHSSVRLWGNQGAIHMATTTYTVRTAGELETVLAKATGGETILLEGGDYGLLRMGKYSSIAGDYASEVTISAADSSNPPVFTKMSLLEVKNLSISGAVFDYTYIEGTKNSERPFQIVNCDSVSVKDSLFIGDTAQFGDSGTAGTGIALTVRGSSGIDVAGNEFTGFYKGIHIFESSDVTFTSNDVHDMRSDGMNVNSVAGLVIEGNHFHDFVAAANSDDHRDFIQFWNHENDTPTSNVVIRDNFLDIGEGSWTQSIFIRNEYADYGAGKGSYYKNFLIENNVILNAHLHGITVGQTDGLTIRNNTVLESGDDFFAAPRINVAEESTNVSILRNVTHSINGAGSGWVISNNVPVQFDSPDKPGYYADSFFFSTVFDSGIPAVIPGSPVDAMKAGAFATWLSVSEAGMQLKIAEAQEPGPRIGFAVYDDAGDATTKVFDAAAIMSVQGYSASEIGGMRFSWKLSDGTVAEGPVMSRDFDKAGVHGVSLEVTFANGQTAATAADVVVLSPTLLQLGSQGLAISDGGEDQIVYASGGQIEIKPTGLAAEVKHEALSRIGHAEGFTLGLEVQADHAGSAGGEVMQIIGMLRIVTKGADLVVVANTDLGERITLAAKNSGINDGQAHQIGIEYDAEAGTIGLSVDGELLSSGAMSGHLDGSRTRLIFGDPWGKPNFEGVVSEFRIDVDDPARTYDGLWTPVTAASAPLDGGADMVLPDLVVPIGDSSDAPDGDASGAATPQFDLATADPGDIQLNGATIVETGSEGRALRFNGDGGYAQLTGPGEATGDGAFSVSLSYVNDRPDSAARLLWNHQTFGIEVKDETIKVYTKVEGSERMKVFSAQADSLDDGGERKIAVAIDSDLDRIQILVDGEVVLDEAGKVDLDLADEAGARDWGWWVGTPWSRAFDGDVTDLVFHDQAIFEPSAAPQDDHVLLS